MKTVSEILRKEREKKEYTLEQISEATKIGISYLQNIEKGNYMAFSSTINAKGFIKNYANFLGLDLNEIDAIFRREQAIKEKKVLTHNVYKKINLNKFVLSPSYLIGIITFLIAAGIIGYFVFEYKAFDSPPILSITSPQQNQIASTDSISISGKTDIGNKILIDGESIPLSDTLGNFQIQIELHPGNNTISIASQNAFGKTNTKSVNVIYNPPITSPTPQPSQDIKALTMQLNITGQSSWINLTIDGKLILNAIIPANTEKTFTGKNTIDFKTGRSSNTILTVNNQNIPISGTGVVEKYISVDSNGNLTVTP